MLETIIIGVGVALCLEGLLYALVPGFMKRVLASMQFTSDFALRVSGALVLAAGVLIVALMR